MNQCLRCQEPCRDDTEFCENCRAHLQNRLHQSNVLSVVSNSEQVIDIKPEATNIPDQVIERSISNSHQNCAAGPKNELAFSPKTSTVALRETKKIILIKYEDTGENESLQDILDPLVYRQLPKRDDATIIEREDLQRVNDRVVTISRPISSSVPHFPRQRFQITMKPLHVRLSLLLITLLVIMTLITSSVLIFLNMNRQPAHVNIVKALPSLSVTPGAIYPDQIVQVHMSNFESSARIRLTRDVAKNVRTDANTSTIILGTNGTGDVRVFVDESWGSGAHTIEAEDITTHYIASTALQVLNELPVHPPHLILSSPGTTTALKGMLDMGSNEQGANTLQSLVLHNSGGGWISWSATSNQPWLMTTPQQGIFQDGQSIIVAVSRANLKAGKYEGIITIVSNTGAPLSVQIRMNVLPLFASQIAVSSIIQMTPPALSFISTDGGTDPASQNLMISNPGSQTLNWSLSVTALQDSFNQEFSSQDDVTWLSADETSGAVSPGKNSKINIKIQSKNLLPSVYSALLTFTSGRDTLNAPQAVAVSLTIQPRCGIATNQGTLSFNSTSGPNTIFTHILNLSTTIGCTSVVKWESFSSSSWLNISPASGQLQANVNSIVTVQVNTSDLQPGSYTGAILLVTKQRSLTVVVQMLVASSTTSTATAASTAASVLGVSTRGLQFTMTQGQGNPASQSFMVSNNGGENLYWQANFDSAANPWLSLNPIRGTIGSAQGMSVGVSVQSVGLPSGDYSALITVIGTDNSGNQVQGSPQIIQVTLTVLPGCSFQVSPANLTFTARSSKPNPPAQDIILTITGSCFQSVSWTATVNTGGQNWLILPTTSGTTSNLGSSILVKVRSRPLLPGNYSGQIMISGSGSAILNSPVSVPVTLTVTF